MPGLHSLLLDSYYRKSHSCATYRTTIEAIVGNHIKISLIELWRTAVKFNWKAYISILDYRFAIIVDRAVRKMYNIDVCLHDGENELKYAIEKLTRIQIQCQDL